MVLKGCNFGANLQGLDHDMTQIWHIIYSEIFLVSNIQLALFCFGKNIEL